MNKQMFGGSRFIIALAMVVLAALSAQALAGPVLYVDDDAPPGGNGAGWTTAYRFLQDAVSDASGGGVSEVRVAQGIYRPDQDEAGNVTPGDRDATFQLITDVALRGGYAGLGAPDPDERDIELYETVLSGDLLGDDGPDFANNEENSYNVVTGSGTDETAVLDGFSVTAGNANGPDNGELNWERGAGMWNFSGSPTVNDCKFQKNRAQWNGGGMYNHTNSSPTVLGCTFNGNVAVEQSGGGMFNYLSSPTVSNCTIVGNFAQTYGGGMFNHTNSSPTVTNATFNGNVATESAGGGMYNFESSPTVIECTFSDNSAGTSNGGAVATRNGTVTVAACIFTGNSAGGGGAMFSAGSGSISVTDSVFMENSAGLGGAMFITNDVAATLETCTFTNNDAELTVGALVAAGSSATLIGCSFIRNSADWFMGGVLNTTDATLVNCIFSRNTGDLAGGLYSASDSTLINSTFSNNLGGAIALGTDSAGTPADVTLANCILWGNAPHQIAYEGGSGNVNFSDIQGGWSGPGGNNIDADPLFVQPGLDNVRLSFGSPCINVGSNAALPPDELDLDGDGDTDEPIPYDLDGNDRIQAGIVDMGAYEGEHEPLPPGSSDSDMDLDQGETAFLIPGGGLFDPLKSAAVIFTNVSGPDNATVTVTEWYQSVHPGAGGYSDLTSTLTIETSLDDGQFLALVFLPFNPDVLGGIDPFQPNLTSFDPTIGNWALAVAGNTVNSPGFPWPIGDRVIVEGPGGYELTQDLGDYGVYWLPSAQQGFVWANVDYAADLALGAALCPPDCRQTPDGVVDVFDILAVLTAWGDAAGGGPCDLDTNGSVDQSDLLAVLSAWGPCSPSANSQGPLGGVRTVAAFTLPSRTSRVGNSHGLDRDPVTAVEPSSRGDLDGNGRVDRNDLLILRSSWGPCADGPDSCPTDLDGDGVVGVADILTLLANWG